LLNTNSHHVDMKTEIMLSGFFKATTLPTIPCRTCFCVSVIPVAVAAPYIWITSALFWNQYRF
jgi:hypothetical protein